MSKKKILANIANGESTSGSRYNDTAYITKSRYTGRNPGTKNLYNDVAT